MRVAHDPHGHFSARPRQVLPHEAEQAIEEADVLLDVREPGEFAAGHLAGARLVPLRLLQAVMPATPELSSRDLNLLVYCKTSGRSSIAAAQLHAMGYHKVGVLAGGFDHWLAQGKPFAK